MNKVSGTDRASNFVIGNDEQMENFITKQTDEISTFWIKIC